MRSVTHSLPNTLCIAAVLAALVCATACDSLPSWAGGTEKKVVAKDKDKRLPIVPEDALLAANPDAKGVIADVPDQVSNESWLNINDAMQAGHLGITGLEQAASASIGEGADFEQGIVPTPVVGGGTVFAMDGEGAISAHDAKNIDRVRFVNSDLVAEDEPATLGGGLSLHEGVLYAATGYGKLGAFDANTGKRSWMVNVGVPVRGAPQAATANGTPIVVVVTVDNQTLAYEGTTGRSLWTHRGIRETASYLSAISPVIAGDMVIVGYSSGELNALRLSSGDPVWGDALLGGERTGASDVFTGMDADPVVKDSIVYAISTSKMMVANALLNGRTLWQQKISGYDTPWVVGNMLYLLNEKHQLLGLSRGNGEVVWAKNLGTKDSIGRDTTPRLFGPILAGNAVIVINDDGELITFRPSDGKKLGVYDVADEVGAPPVIAEGALYLVTRDASLVQYK